MENFGGKDVPRGQSVEKEIYETSSKLDKNKRLLKIVDVTKLPDRGMRLKKEIDELEELLKILNLKVESLENDESSVPLEKNQNSSSCDENNHKSNNNNVAFSRRDHVEDCIDVKKENKSSKYTSSLTTKSSKQSTASDKKKIDAKLVEESCQNEAAEFSKNCVRTSSCQKKNYESSSNCSSEAISKNSKQIITIDNKRSADGKDFVKSSNSKDFVKSSNSKDFVKSSNDKDCVKSSNSKECVKSVAETNSHIKNSHISSSVDFMCATSSEKENQNSCEPNFGAVPKLSKQTAVIQIKTDTKPAFTHRFETELASFDQLSKGAPKLEGTLKDLVDSPSFKNWRSTNQISGIKLTEAKPLFESFPVYKCKSKYTANVAGTLATEETVKKLHNSLCTYPDDATEVPPPKSLETALLKHQIKGLSWLIWRETQQPSGGILADDMGLGKTLTMISLILKQKEENNYLSENSDDSTCGTLIVCLASIVHQWKDEITKHCEDDALSILLYHGPKRDRDIDEMKKYDIVLTTYNILLSERKSLMKERKPTGLFLLKWERVILDEAHTIKNYKSQTAEAVFSLRSCRRWCVTGTPIHNEFKDMYSLVKFLQFSPFDDEKKWKKLINDETASSDKRRNLLVKSILLRRTKEDNDRAGRPLIKMVKKTINVCSIELSEAEQIVYDKLDSKIKDILSKIFHKPTKSLNTSNTLLVLLLRLQQCCCHISLLGKEADDDETISNDSMQELSLNLSSLDIKDRSDVSRSSSSGESSLDLSFSEYLNTDLCDPHVKSTKLQKLYEMINEIAKKSNNKDKCVIVSQWVSLLDIVASHLQKIGMEYHMIAGSTKAEDRQKMSEDFNYNDDGCKIMLLSLKAGGVGLNLVGGNHMFLLDLHWNPALEKQACDRIHRVGQTKDVSIYKFVCKNTIEQRIFELQCRKSELADDILHGAGKISKGLSMEDFKSLFNVRL
ncbi:transcription termination factor 2-like [Argiope bruennichi]|uniref:transcription termination factor 2-like n=1 Tax=Argiope bruennichi TaxID=94029 RepID=UPI002493F0A7|nr:transcription termination factor 2-like [Argiope bruennichi]